MSWRLNRSFRVSLHKRHALVRMPRLPREQVNIVRRELTISGRVDLSILGRLAPTVEAEQEEGQEESADQPDASADTC